MSRRLGGITPVFVFLLTFNHINVESVKCDIILHFSEVFMLTISVIVGLIVGLFERIWENGYEIK